MHPDQIVAELDTFFRLDTFEADAPFSHLLPSTYAPTGIRLATYLESAFLERFHGLMLRSGGKVDAVYTAVFLSDEIVGKLTAWDAKDALLVCHHPLVMETSGRGFLPLSQTSLAGMRDRAISVYILHTPLDVHDEISTSRALAREIGLREVAEWHAVPGGYAGVHGPLPMPTPFQDLLARVRGVTGVVDLHYIQKGEVVRSVAVLGGGTDVSGIEEARDLGCDVLVTGTYHNEVQNEIGQRYRDAFERARPSLAISLVECSHYASEAVVMRQDLVKLCAQRLGLQCGFVPQEDPWY
ncbi:MAG TPA: Nif3-like dinuclear metal center hexameric protein [Anaerolineae bacterium]|nr:Nif3-like dinuclear metal center hexameric protein [Anaerolineae bacterium]